MLPSLSTAPGPAALVRVPEHLHRWDVYCRVIDNHGDLGVCWRFARDLAGRGARVRLWVDDPSALIWMAPDGSPGIEVLPWRDVREDDPPPDVVVEAFGCEPPPGALARMAATNPPPLWINLEYLSAEPYVERSHGLASPQWSGPAQGLTRWFYYPGFTAGTGGLIREPALLARRNAQQRHATLARVGVHPAGNDHPDLAVMLLFGYEQPALPAWLDLLADAGLAEGDPRVRTRLLVTAGHSSRQVRAWQARRGEPGPVVGSLQLHFLPYVTQIEFDRLLWASDLNLVRGEDSLVRALWAGRPMLWQLYPQDDGAHATKLEAFMAQALNGTDAALADDLRALARIWNGLQPAAALADVWPRLWLQRRAAWTAAATTRSQRWADEPDLVTRLLTWASERRSAH